VLIVGRLETGRPKGHDELIACWPTVAAAVPGARLAIVGRGPDHPRIRGIAASSAAAASIDLLGFVSDQELERLYNRAAVFAMPSRGEGFGLVYIEAMRHGLPVVGSVHDAAPEVNLDGVTGANVDLDRPGQLAERLVELLRDRALASRLGEAARARWQANFRYSCFRERVRPVLEALVRL
jgi:phosphatidylinositol alpha-1,6-mannosyltransferase